MKNVRDFLVTYFEGVISKVGDLSKIFESVTSSKLWRYNHYRLLEELAESFLQMMIYPEQYVSQLSVFYITSELSEWKCHIVRMLLSRGAKVDDLNKVI